VAVSTVGRVETAAEQARDGAGAGSGPPQNQIQGRACPVPRTCHL